MREYVDLANPGEWSNLVEFGIPGEYGLVGVCLVASFASIIFHLVKVSKADAEINP